MQAPSLAGAHAVLRELFYLWQEHEDDLGAGLVVVDFLEKLLADTRDARLRRVADIARSMAHSYGRRGRYMSHLWSAIVSSGKAVSLQATRQPHDGTLSARATLLTLSSRELAERGRTAFAADPRRTAGGLAVPSTAGREGGLGGGPRSYERCEGSVTTAD